MGGAIMNALALAPRDELADPYPPVAFDDDDRHAEYLDQLADAFDADLDLIEAASELDLADAKHVQSAIAIAVEAKRTAEDVAAPWNARVARARAWLATACQGGARWNTAVGSAYVSAPSTRASWDDKSLMALCDDDPALAERILRYRKVTNVAGALTVKGA